MISGWSDSEIVVWMCVAVRQTKPGESYAMLAASSSAPECQLGSECPVISVKNGPMQLCTAHGWSRCTDGSTTSWKKETMSPPTEKMKAAGMANWGKLALRAMLPMQVVLQWLRGYFVCSSMQVQSILSSAPGCSAVGKTVKTLL